MMKSSSPRFLLICFMAIFTNVVATSAVSSNETTINDDATTMTVHWLDSCLCLAILLFIFLGMAIVCDDYLVPAMERLCEHLDIPEEAAGASFLAFGSAAPEILLNVAGTINGKVEASLAAVFGSAIIAYGLIPGVCSLMAPDRSLELSLRPLVRDVGFFLIGLVSLAYSMADGEVSTLESTLLSTLFFVYMLAIYIPILLERRRDGQHNANDITYATLRSHVSLSGIFKESFNPQSSLMYSTIDGNDDGEANSGNAAKNALMALTNACSIPYYKLFGYTLPDCQEGSAYHHLYPLTLILSVAYVSLFSEGALVITRRLATDLGISESLAGVTLLALGSQVPDAIASVAMAKNGMANGAVSNAIGSQVINVTLGSGAPFLVYNLVNQMSLVVPVANVSVISYCLIAVIVSYLVITLKGLLRTPSSVGITATDGMILLGIYAVTNVVIVTLLH